MKFCYLRSLIIDLSEYTHVHVPNFIDFLADWQVIESKRLMLQESVFIARRAIPMIAFPRVRCMFIYIYIYIYMSVFCPHWSGITTSQMN